MGKPINRGAKRLWHAVFALCLVIAGTAAPLPAEEGSLNATLDWINMKIDVSVGLSLPKLNLSLPTGRTQAEDRLYGEFFAKIENFIYVIPVDSSSCISDYLNRGIINQQTIDEIVLATKAVPPAISADLQRISSTYAISLTDISSRLVTHGKGSQWPRLVSAPAVLNYTGVIIIADSELPIHGRHSQTKVVPCIFPKIWDSEMQLIYDKKFAEPALLDGATLVNYAPRGSIFQKTPSGFSPAIRKIVGDKPLRIIARGVFGIRATDPIIDKDDARILLASEENRRLLREGKVVFVISDEMLSMTFNQ